MTQMNLRVSFRGPLNAGALIVLCPPLQDSLASKEAGICAIEPGGQADGILLERGDPGDLVTVELFGFVAETELTHWNGQEEIIPGQPLFGLGQFGPDGSALPIRGVCPLGGQPGQAGYLIGKSLQAFAAAEVALPHRLLALFYPPSLDRINGLG